MKRIDWDELSKRGLLRGVLDPNDAGGAKNLLIDRIHWQAISRHLSGPGRLLDYGCGTGRYAGRITARGIAYAGVDTSQGMIDQAKSHNPRLAGEFSVIAPGSDLPFPGGSFDYCLTTGVLQYLIHTPHMRTVLNEFRRVLRPGGTVIIIEQVTRSGQASSLSLAPSTEDDYREALAPHFGIERLERVRTCSFGRLASWLLGRNTFSGGRLSPVVSLIARGERLRARVSGDSFLRSIPYYDIFIKAVR